MQENVFGILVDIVSRAEARSDAFRGKDPVYYGVMRCRDLASEKIPPQIRARNLIMRCTKCGEPCWVDGASYVPGMIIRCFFTCVPAKAEKYAIDDVVAEIRRIHGKR